MQCDEPSSSNVDRSGPEFLARILTGDILFGCVLLTVRIVTVTFQFSSSRKSTKSENYLSLLSPYSIMYVLIDLT